MQAVIGAPAGESGRARHAEFLQELTRRLKLNAQLQILVSLSLLESTLDSKEDENLVRDSKDEAPYEEALKLFRQKLVEFHQNGKPD